MNQDPVRFIILDQSYIIQKLYFGLQLINLCN